MVSTVRDLRVLCDSSFAQGLLPLRAPYARHHHRKSKQRRQNTIEVTHMRIRLNLRRPKTGDGSWQKADVEEGLLASRRPHCAAYESEVTMVNEQRMVWAN